MNDTCLLCKAPTLSNIPTAVDVWVTSDSKPWPRTGNFCTCTTCGHVQKRLTSEWLKGIDRIYREYKMSPLSNGQGATPRTRRLLNNFQNETTLPTEGRLLDIGCGNGAFLRSFATLFPDWTLQGCDQKESRKDIIESLLGVENFHCGPFEDIDKQFDMISMVYVIEHLFDPMQAMLAVRAMLSPEGLFFIHTSDLTENPFDLPVVDHCSHFTLEGLEAAVTKARFEVLASSSTWCPKEIGVIARVSKNLKDENIPVDISKGKYIAKAHLTWLAAIRSQGLALADESPLGVFGTSNAGVWLTASMRELVSFFVDDDEKKQGKSYLDLPVYGLDAIPEKTSVLLAFPTTIAQTIAKCSSRKRPDIHFHIPKHTGE